MAICPYCKKEIDSNNLTIEEISKKAFKFSYIFFLITVLNIDGMIILE